MPFAAAKSQIMLARSEISLELEQGNPRKVPLAQAAKYLWKSRHAQPPCATVPEEVRKT